MLQYAKYFGSIKKTIRTYVLLKVKHIGQQGGPSQLLQDFCSQFCIFNLSRSKGANRIL